MKPKYKSIIIKTVLIISAILLMALLIDFIIKGKYSSVLWSIMMIGGGVWGTIYLSKHITSKQFTRDFC